MGKLRKRMSFSRINEGLEMPDLIEVQKRSYQRFLETDLKEVLADASPITNYNGNLELTFTDYSLGEPKNSVERCRERDMTYAAPLNIHVHLYDSETSEIKETDVYMGDFPLMTENGTFVINGADRVIVSQLVRSPGCYYTRTLDKAGVPLYSSQIIPNRGAWLEYETDSNDIIWVRLDRARKLCLTTLLRALGYETDDDIRNLLGNDKRLEATMAKDTTVAEASKDRGGAVRTLREQALLIIYKKQKPDEPESVESATNMFKSLFYDPKRYDVMRVGRYKFNKKLSIATRINKHIIAEDIIDPRTGEVMFRAGQVIDLETARRVQNAGVNRVVVDCEGEKRIVIGNNFVDAAEYLPFDPKEVGILEMVHLPTLKAIIDGLGEDVEEEQLKQVIADNVQHLVPKHITDDDMVASISYLLGLPYGIGTTDDIDHLGNRRLRSVGELGDWGVFPTELSQQLRHITAEYEMTFFAGDLVESNRFRSAYQFQVPYTVAQTKVHAGTLPTEKSWLTWEGERMMFSNFKEKAEGTDRMARFVNCSGEPTVLRIKKDASFETLYFSNILEEEVRPETANADGWYEIPVRGFEIVTVGMR